MHQSPRLHAERACPSVAAQWGQLVKPVVHQLLRQLNTSYGIEMLFELCTASAAALLYTLSSSSTSLARSESVHAPTWLCPAAVLLPSLSLCLQVCLALLALLLVTLHAPPASASLADLGRVTQDRSLTDPEAASFQTNECHQQAGGVGRTQPCSGINLPTPACCNSAACTGRKDREGGSCDASTTFTACCPPTQTAHPPLRPKFVALVIARVTRAISSAPTP
jgi:hypothetical protein